MFLSLCLAKQIIDAVRDTFSCFVCLAKPALPQDSKKLLKVSRSPEDCSQSFSDLCDLEWELSPLYVFPIPKWGLVILAAFSNYYYEGIETS
jgi:hypothetical protein